MLDPAADRAGTHLEVFRGIRHVEPFLRWLDLLA
jgi:hypothetical protein